MQICTVFYAALLHFDAKKKKKNDILTFKNNIKTSWLNPLTSGSGNEYSGNVINADFASEWRKSRFRGLEISKFQNPIPYRE